MKIAFFTDTYYPDLNGVSISVDNYATELRKKGHKVYIFAPKIKGKYKDEDMDLIRLPSIRIISKVEPEIYSPLLWFNKQFRQMFSRNFDIIHAHGNGPYSLLGYSIAKIKKIPFVMTFHTIHTNYTHYIFNGKLIKPKMVEYAFKVFANRCKVVFVPSKKMALELIKYGVRKKIHITPNFLDIKKFKNLKKGFIHELLKLPEDTPIILTVGRIGKEKNIDFILRVFKKIHENNKKVHLVIVGQGPEKDNLLEYAKELGISHRVHFAGRIDYDFMPLVYKDADIFTFASYTETQGVCVLEAATAGIPSVVNDDPAFDGMIKNEESGFMLPLDENEFIRKLNFLLDNKQKRFKMGQKAVKIALDNFSGDKITEDLLEIYSEILGNK